MGSKLTAWGFGGGAVRYRASSGRSEGRSGRPSRGWPNHQIESSSPGLRKDVEVGSPRSPPSSRTGFFRCAAAVFAGLIRRTALRWRQLMGTLLFTHGGVNVQPGLTSTTPLPPVSGYIEINPFCPPPGTAGLPSLIFATIRIVMLSTVSWHLGIPRMLIEQWTRLIGTSQTTVQPSLLFGGPWEIRSVIAFGLTTCLPRRQSFWRVVCLVVAAVASDQYRLSTSYLSLTRSRLASTRAFSLLRLAWCGRSPGSIGRCLH